MGTDVWMGMGTVSEGRDGRGLGLGEYHTKPRPDKTGKKLKGT